MSTLRPTMRQAIDRVHDRLEGLVVEWYGPGARLLDREPGMTRRAWSLHFSLTVVTTDGVHNLIAKIPTWEAAPDVEAALAAGPQASTRAEFEALSGMAGAVLKEGDPTFAAVVPIAYVEDINAIVTARLDSQPLRDHLRPPVGAFTPVLLERIGRLLRLFHEEVGNLRRGAGSTDGVARLIADVEDLARIPSGMAAGMEALVRSAAEADLSAIDVANAHNDLNPSNVLITPSGEVALVDPNPGEGAAVADLAKLVVAIRTLPRHLVSGGRWPGRSTIARWTRALMNGYRPVDYQALGLFRALETARRWVEVEPRLTRLGLLRGAAREVFETELEDALNQRW